MMQLCRIIRKMPEKNAKNANKNVRNAKKLMDFITHDGVNVSVIFLA